MSLKTGIFGPSWRALPLVILLAATGVSGCHAVVPSTPLVDPVKAAQMSEARKRELDIQLANELATWNTNTRHFNGAAAAADSGVLRALPEAEQQRIVRRPFADREAWFAQLAEEGYEMAAIAARIVKPSRGRVVPDKGAYRRLKELAEEGDQSALCFATVLLSKLTTEQPAPLTREEAVRYVKTGSQLGLPLCRTTEAFLIEGHLNGYAYDRERVLRQLHEGANAGLYEAYRRLFNAFAHKSEREGFSNLNSVQAALCWGRLASRHKPDEAYYYLANLKSAAWKKNNFANEADRPELMALAKEWDPLANPLNTKPTSSKDCIQLEQER